MAKPAPHAVPRGVAPRSVAPRSVAPRAVKPHTVSAPRGVAPRGEGPRGVGPRSVTPKVKVHAAKAAMPARVITKTTAMHWRDVSVTQIQTWGHSPTRFVRVVRVPAAKVKVIQIKHVALQNVTFLTGRVVRRSGDIVYLQTANGPMPVLLRSVTIVQNVLVPGTTVVVPAQFVNGSYVLVPAFTAEQEDLGALPVEAPCAYNDGDADDNGFTGTFAPIGACSLNDGDADDGYTIPALTSGFSIPNVFSSGFMPVIASGVIVAHMGSNVVLMTPNFTPMIINASAAINSGATNGALTTGRYVTVYGFNVNNTLVATSLV